MADFNLIINDNHDMDLIASVEHTEFNSLLSNDVVMSWLTDLEAEDAAADLEDARQDAVAYRLHA